MAVHLKQLQLKLKIEEWLSDEILDELTDQGTPELLMSILLFPGNLKLIQICLELLPHNLLNK